LNYVRNEQIRQFELVKVLVAVKSEPSLSR